MFSEDMLSEEPRNRMLASDMAELCVLVTRRKFHGGQVKGFACWFSVAVFFVIVGLIMEPSANPTLSFLALVFALFCAMRMARHSFGWVCAYAALESAVPAGEDIDTWVRERAHAHSLREQSLVIQLERELLSRPPRNI